MKKKIIFPIVSVLSLAFISGLVNKTNTPNDSTKDLVESTKDYLNEQNGIEQVNVKALNSNSALDCSTMYTQYAFDKNDGSYYLRFATAIKGDVTSLSYKRVVAGIDDNIIYSYTLYKGISANGEVNYYDGKELSTDTQFAGNYYWSCYTIKFAKSSIYKEKDITVELSVNGDTTITRTISLNTLLNEDRYLKCELFNVEVIDNRVYYIVTGSCFGYEESDISHDLYGNGKDYALGNQTVTIDYANNTFKILTDVTEIPVDEAFLFPHISIKGKKSDIKDNDQSSNGKSVSLGNKNYSIVCTTGENSTWNMPVLSVTNATKSFELQKIGLKTVDERVLYYVSGYATGYSYDQLRLDIIVSEGDYAKKGKYNVTKDSETNIFEVSIDVTDVALMSLESEQGMPHFFVNGIGYNVNGSHPGNGDSDLLYKSVDTNNANVIIGTTKYSIVNRFNMASLKVERYLNLDIEGVGVKVEEVDGVKQVFYFISGKSYAYTKDDTFPAFDLRAQGASKKLDDGKQIVSIDENNHTFEVKINVTNAEILTGAGDGGKVYFNHKDSANVSSSIKVLQNNAVLERKVYTVGAVWEIRTLEVNDKFLEYAKGKVEFDLTLENEHVYYILKYKGFGFEASTDVIYIDFADKSRQSVTKEIHDDNYDLYTIKIDVTNLIEATSEVKDFFPHLKVNGKNYGNNNGDINGNNMEDKIIELDGVKYTLMCVNKSPSWSIPILRIVKA